MKLQVEKMIRIQLLLLLGLAMAGDVLSTYLALSKPYASERNPLGIEIPTFGKLASFSLASMFMVFSKNKKLNFYSTFFFSSWFIIFFYATINNFLVFSVAKELPWMI